MLQHIEDDIISKIRNSSFLVTGGAGFIGSNIVENLIHFGAKKVKVLDNLSTGSLENINEFKNQSSFEFIEGDIRDLNICLQAVDGIDYIAHQAALGSVPRSIKDPITTNEVNINGFLNILHAARASSSLKRMVYAASSSSYGDSVVMPKVEGSEGALLSPYAVTKWVNELYGDVFSKAYGFHTIGLRYFNVFGPRQQPDNPYAAVIPLFFKAALNNMSPTINGDGSHSRDFTFVDNVVQANLKALLGDISLKKHEVMNIAVGERTTLIELWNYISEITQNNIAPNYGPTRPGDIPHSHASIAKAKRIIGYSPNIKIKEGLEMTYKWFLNQSNR